VIRSAGPGRSPGGPHADFTLAPTRMQQRRQVRVGCSEIGCPRLQGGRDVDAVAPCPVVPWGSTAGGCEDQGLTLAASAQTGDKRSVPEAGGRPKPTAQSQAQVVPPCRASLASTQRSASAFGAWGDDHRARATRFVRGAQLRAGARNGLVTERPVDMPALRRGAGGLPHLVI